MKLVIAMSQLRKLNNRIFEGQNKEITEAFNKLVAARKVTIPHSDKFLYFRARAITAMEAANLDSKGNVIGNGYWDYNTNKWVGDYDPYINANSDAFPEKELITAVNTFINKGFFLEHQTDDARLIRGSIIDAKWDDKFKCIENLVCIDKNMFPILASDIKNKRATDVSMGVMGEASYCSYCSNKSTGDHDVCEHLRRFKGKTIHGQKIYETYVNLSFSELSGVSVGADENAFIKEVYASYKHKNPRERLKVVGNELIKLAESHWDLSLHVDTDEFLNNLDEYLGRIYGK